MGHPKKSKLSHLQANNSLTPNKKTIGKTNDLSQTQNQSMTQLTIAV